MAAEARSALSDDCCNREVEINSEFRDGVEHVSMKASTGDVARQLVEEGLLMVDKRRDPRVRTLIEDYLSAQEAAKRAHKNIWQYGDITEDDEEGR